jgi:diguanylate cyclase (GGDEF)-like protein
MGIAPNSADFRMAIGSDLLADVPRGVLESVLPRCEVVELAQGQTLIGRGQRNEHLYLVLSGRLRVQLDDGRLPHYLVIGPGECAGEVSVIDGRGASGSAIGMEASRLLRIDRQTLWYLVGATEAAARNLLLIFSGRMRRDNDLLLASLRQRREFERMATVDGLTGLHNRRWLDDVFPRQMERCRRTGLSVSLIFADVDSFKAFNDLYGHLNGDRALQHVANVLVTCLRPTDLIARYGGEEFAALLPGASLEQAELVAERLRAAVQRTPFAIESESEPQATATISLGIAELRPGDTLSALTAAADAALYQAKSDGRNCVRRRDKSRTG